MAFGRSKNVNTTLLMHFRSYNADWQRTRTKCYCFLWMDTHWRQWHQIHASKSFFHKLLWWSKLHFKCIYIVYPSSQRTFSFFIYADHAFCHYWFDLVLKQVTFNNIVTVVINPSGVLILAVNFSVTSTKHCAWQESCITSAHCCWTGCICGTTTPYHFQNFQWSYVH